MVFIVVSCLKLGLDVLVQKLENIKDFRTLRIHIWLFLSTGSLSAESTNSNSEVFEKNFWSLRKTFWESFKKEKHEFALLLANIGASPVAQW